MRPLALVVALALLVGCGASQATPQQPAQSAELSAELVRYRGDEALHRLQVKVTNGGPGATLVDRIELDLPGFSGRAEAAPDARLEPGRRVDLPVVYGAALCEGDAQSGVSSDSSMWLWRDGEAEPVTLVPADPRGLVARLAAEECAVRAVTDAVPLSFADTWTPVGSGSSLVVQGVLRVGPASEPATLVRVDGTTLFSVTTPPLPIDLGEAVDVPVTVSPQRCDPHAVAESKRGYAFLVGISLGGAEPVLVTVEVEEAERSVLLAGLLERCGL